MTRVKCGTVCSYYYCTIIPLKLPYLKGLSSDPVTQVDATPKFPSDTKQRDPKEQCREVKGKRN